MNHPKPLEIDQTTGEIKTMPTAATQVTPKQMRPPDLALGGGLVVMSPEQAKKAVAYLQEVKQSIMTEGADYGTIPGCKRPSLWKPGAQKLCALFNLAPSYELESCVEDPNLRWEYDFYNTYKKQKETRAVRGFYSYRVKCSLHHRETNVLWGTGIGNCVQSEKGKQQAEPNTLLKMAQKRAFVQVVLDSTFSSELFTQDEDSYTRPEFLPETSRIDDSPVPKPATPKTREATKAQLHIIRELMAGKILSDKLTVSVKNFLGDKNLQIADNADMLIKKLNVCAPKKPKEEVNTELTILLEWDKDKLINEIGSLATKICNTVTEESNLYKKLTKDKILTTPAIAENNKGALARCIIALRKSTKEKK